MDGDRPVHVRDDLVSGVSGSDLRAVPELVLPVAGGVEVICRQILEGGSFAVVDVVEDLSRLPGVTGVDAGGVGVRDLAQDLAVRYLLRGADGAALIIIDG